MKLEQAINEVFPWKLQQELPFHSRTMMAPFTRTHHENGDMKHFSIDGGSCLGLWEDYCLLAASVLEEAQ